MRGRTLTNSLQAFLLFLRYLVPPARRNSFRLGTPNGPEYDFYPSEKSRKTFILLYGWDMAGEKDARLVRLAHAFAGSGFDVAVPSLAGLKNYRFDMKDIEDLCSLVQRIHGMDDKSVGLAAFSAGAGMALLVATKEHVTGMVDPLLLFSPYYSLQELYDALSTMQSLRPEADEEWDDFVWSRAVAAFRSVDSLDFSEEEKKELFTLLYDYCNESSLLYKKDFYRRVLAHRSIPFLHEEDFKKFSPEGNLRTIWGRVIILHDRNDRLIPPSHSKRIVEELGRKNDGRHCRLLVTPLLSHVNLRSSLNLHDLVSMMGMVGQIFGGD